MSSEQAIRSSAPKSRADGGLTVALMIMKSCFIHRLDQVVPLLRPLVAVSLIIRLEPAELSAVSHRRISAATYDGLPFLREQSISLPRIMNCPALLLSMNMAPPMTILENIAVEPTRL